ncbi:MAG: flippase-like domain-containing protein [Phycisphaerae bacterium]|nr:flippase-like domain-containing protein [Phycisphaerae bacterium]
MRKQIKNFIWLMIAFVAIGFLVYKTDWDRFKEAIVGIYWPMVIGAVVLYFMAQTLLASRWMILLKVHGVSISFFQAVKLTYLGLFYNNMMPGAVGGDLLKGWYITRHSDETNRVSAVVTVFVDRLIGLIGMIMVATVASFFIGREIAYKQFQIRWLVWATLGAMVLAAVLFLSKRIRQKLLISLILEKLPFSDLLKKIDSSIRIYRQHKTTIVLSLLLTATIQGLSIVAIWILTQALHFDKVTFVQCLTILPVIWVIGAAIPVPGGLGIIEGCITYLFSMAIDPVDPAGATERALALALLNRMMICFCSLPGALVPIFGGHLPKANEMETELNKNRD